MNSTETKRYLFLCTLCLALLFLANGCARKQWRAPLAEDQDKAIRSLLQTEKEKWEKCPSCIDANLTAVLDSQISSGSITGYIQILLPSSVKIVAINPLGQPLFAITTDSINFQTINAVKGVYKYGRLASFAERYSLPKNVLDGNWGQWLTGRLIYTDDQLIAIRQDVTLRGVWLTVEKTKKNIASKEFLLFDPAAKHLLERIIMSPDGDEVARILYSGWQRNTICPLPTTIQINGISFGAEIKIEMEDILTDKTFNKNDFFLKLPPGYVQQYYP